MEEKKENLGEEVSKCENICWNFYIMIKKKLLILTYS